MNIEPIQFGTLGKEMGLNQANSVGAAPTAGFQDIFKNAWDDAEFTQQDLAEKQYLQSIGEIEDTHTVPIAISKAEISLNMLVSLRNKALEAYNELIRINV